MKNILLISLLFILTSFNTSSILHVEGNAYTDGKAVDCQVDIVNRETKISKVLYTENGKYSFNLPLNYSYILLFYRDSCQIKVVDIVTYGDTSQSYKYKFDVSLPVMKDKMKMVHSVAKVYYDNTAKQYTHKYY